MEKTTLIQHLEQSIDADNFVRFTLSKNRDNNSDLKKVLIKLVVIKQEQQLSFVYRHQRKDITKNHPLKEAFAEVERLLSDVFLIYNLFTTKADWSGERRGEEIELKQKPPTFSDKPVRQHDKAKKHLIGKTDYLHHLGVTNAQGNIKKDKGDKYKQINKFVEIVDGLLRSQKTALQNKTLQVVDMGAGKGYLTFALYDYLQNNLKIKAEVTGVEIRPDLIDKCNTIAKAVGFQQLQFEEGFIGNYELPKTDILIALHACDTATDDAIAKGIAADASLIICAPCCHKQIRQQIQGSDLLQSVLNHGILKERQAEIVTDSIRALLLEAKGYKTKVFEFISSEHTGKNVMIVGERHDREVNVNAHLEEIEKLKKTFGIESHYLERLLGGGVVRD